MGCCWTWTNENAAQKQRRPNGMCQTGEAGGADVIQFPREELATYQCDCGVLFWKPHPDGLVLCASCEDASVLKTFEDD